MALHHTIMHTYLHCLQVADVVEQKCRSHQEKEKFRSYIEDMDKIIRLLLKLSGLLARAENTIQGLTENTNEKIKVSFCSNPKPCDTLITNVNNHIYKAGVSTI